MSKAYLRKYLRRHSSGFRHVLLASSCFDLRNISPSLSSFPPFLTVQLFERKTREKACVLTQSGAESERLPV